jgi:hypothetical protein
MKHTETWFAPQATIEITGTDLQIIQKAAVSHYDGTCRSTALPRDNRNRPAWAHNDPFVYNWINRWIKERICEERSESQWTKIIPENLFASAQFARHAECTVSIRGVESSQIDLVCKILEFRGSDTTEKERDLAYQFQSLLTKLIHDCNKINRKVLEASRA